MGYVLIFAAAAALIAAVTLLLPVRVIIDYAGKESTDAKIKIGFLTFDLNKEPEKTKKHAKANVSVQKQPPAQKPSVYKRIKAVLGLYAEFSEDIKSLADYISRHAVRFEKVVFNMRYSAGDAALTGILCGAINGAVYGLLGVIHNRAELEEAEISVVPEFSDAAIDIRAGCIVRLKNVHIIVIAVRLCMLYIKINRSRKRKPI